MAPARKAASARKTTATRAAPAVALGKRPPTEAPAQKGQSSKAQKTSKDTQKTTSNKVGSNAAVKTLPGATTASSAAAPNKAAASNATSTDQELILYDKNDYRWLIDRTAEDFERMFVSVTKKASASAKFSDGIFNVMRRDAIYSMDAQQPPNKRRLVKCTSLSPPMRVMIANTGLGEARPNPKTKVVEWHRAKHSVLVRIEPPELEPRLRTATDKKTGQLFEPDWVGEYLRGNEYWQAQFRGPYAYGWKTIWTDPAANVSVKYTMLKDALIDHNPHYNKDELIAQMENDRIMDPGEQTDRLIDAALAASPDDYLIKISKEAFTKFITGASACHGMNRTKYGKLYVPMAAPAQWKRNTESEVYKSSLRFKDKQYAERHERVIREGARYWRPNMSEDDRRALFEQYPIARVTHLDRGIFEEGASRPTPYDWQEFTLVSKASGDPVEYIRDSRGCRRDTLMLQAEGKKLFHNNDICSFYVDVEPWSSSGSKTVLDPRLVKIAELTPFAFISQRAPLYVRPPGDNRQVHYGVRFRLAAPTCVYYAAGDVIKRSSAQSVPKARGVAEPVFRDLSEGDDGDDDEALDEIGGDGDAADNDDETPAQLANPNLQHPTGPFDDDRDEDEETLAVIAIAEQQALDAKRVAAEALAKEEAASAMIDEDDQEGGDDDDEGSDGNEEEEGDEEGEEEDDIIDDE